MESITSREELQQILHQLDTCAFFKEKLI